MKCNLMQSNLEDAWNVGVDSFRRLRRGSCSIGVEMAEREEALSKCTEGFTRGRVLSAQEVLLTHFDRWYSRMSLFGRFGTNPCS